MRLIAYTSELTNNSDSNNSWLKEIVKIAQAKNAKANITGLLFYHNSRFLQFLEGDHQALEQLMATLEKDIRHKNIVRIIEAEVYTRSFSSWAMEGLNLSQNAVISAAELDAISHIYQQNFNVISNVLSKFYKLMLESRKHSTTELKPLQD